MGRRVEAGRLVVDGGEARAVVRARGLRDEGKSLREIAAALGAEGHRPQESETSPSHDTDHVDGRRPSYGYPTMDFPLLSRNE